MTRSFSYTKKTFHLHLQWNNEIYDLLHFKGKFYVLLFAMPGHHNILLENVLAMMITRKVAYLLF